MCIVGKMRKQCFPWEGTLKFNHYLFWTLSRDIKKIFNAADERMRVLRLLRRRRLARANGPDRFVGDDGFDHLFLGQAGEAAAHLRFQNLFHLAGFAFRQRFADADDRFERRAMHGRRLFGDERVRSF